MQRHVGTSKTAQQPDLDGSIALLRSGGQTRGCVLACARRAAGPQPERALAESRIKTTSSKPETAKKTALAVEKTPDATADLTRSRGAGATRGTQPKPAAAKGAAPRGNKAQKAAREKAEQEAAAKKAGEVAEDSDKEEEEDDEAKATSEEVFWKHLVWGAYRSRKRRGDD